MSRVALIGGAYQARSLIAAAQRAVNLYAEPGPSIAAGLGGSGGSAQGEPSNVAHYPTPGLDLWGTVGPGPIRGLRQASNGAAYAVSGAGVYSFFPATHLGDITPGLHTPVSMHDNGIDLFIVDGTSGGWLVNLASNTMSALTDPGAVYAGSTHVDYLDTYFVFNKPGTPQFYLSDSLATTFDPLWFANKESANDYLVAAKVAKREIWLLGERTTEVWFDSGNAEFPMEIVPNVLVPRGCVAKYSPVEIDNSIYWLTRDKNGQAVVVAGGGYQAKRVSTYAIEAAFAKYGRVDDAIGWSYQLGGHSFYVLTFPHQDVTWSYDIGTGFWHEFLWIDVNGTEHRHRGNCCFNINGVPMVGDWQNGNIYGLSLDNGTDAGNPIKRVRGFPHLLNDGKRVFYRQLIADMETGEGGNATPPLTAPQVSLRWSDDRGHTWGSPVLIDLGATGNYLRSLQWQRLGMARDRVFEISWSTPYQTALQGAWIEVTAAQS